MRRLLIFLLLCLPLGAHYDVNAAVAELTKKISKAPTAELYYKRAIEFRALRKKVHAVSDLRAALKLSPHQPSMAALAEVLSSKEEHEEALRLGHELRELSDTPANNALLARLSLDAGDYENALRYIQKGPPLKDDTFLLHAYLLERGGKHEEAARILKAGHGKTKSIVLRNAWLDTAISAGQVDQVLSILNEEISSSRFTATHRIRRARLLQKKDPQSVKLDLKIALAELSPRIKPVRPDLTLIYDRGVALALSGNMEMASRDLATLRSSSLPRLSYALLTGLLR
jgi:tetratricopeptide (TPR) repeat protein